MCSADAAFALLLLHADEIRLKGKTLARQRRLKLQYGRTDGRTAESNGGGVLRRDIYMTAGMGIIFPNGRFVTVDNYKEFCDARLLVSSQNASVIPNFSKSVHDPEIISDL